MEDAFEEGERLEDPRSGPRNDSAEMVDLLVPA